MNPATESLCAAFAAEFRPAQPVAAQAHDDAMAQFAAALAGDSDGPDYSDGFEVHP